MKKIVALSLMAVTLLVSLCGCNILDTLNDMNSKLYNLNGGEVIEVITEEYYIFSPEFDSCYNSLKVKQKELYSKIYYICEEMPKGFVRLCSNYDGAVRDITIAYRAVLNDHAEIFWMPDTYIIGKSTNDRKNKDICIAFDHSDNGKTIKYTVTAAERDKMREELNSVVNKIVADSEKVESQFDKEKMFNDYICANTEYGGEKTLENTSYGCLVQGKALCEGYSRAFKLLCNKAGIECDLIVGKADGEGHMWNSVNIDGKHSFVDVTWNDRPYYPYFYFNITNEQLEFDHTISPLYTEVSEEKINSGASFNFVERICSYAGNGYYEKYGYVLGDEFDYDYASKASEFITESAKKKAEYADFLLSSKKIREEFLADELAFIGKIQRKLNGIIIDSYYFERDILVVFYKQ